MPPRYYGSHHRASGAKPRPPTAPPSKKIWASRTSFKKIFQRSFLPRKPSAGRAAFRVAAVAPVHDPAGQPVGLRRHGSGGFSDQRPAAAVVLEVPEGAR